MLVRGVRSDILTLNDARTGATIKTLSTGALIKAARYLRDGRIALVDGPNSATVLHILAADGTPQRDILLGAKKWTTIAGDDGTRVVLVESDVAPGPRMYEAVNITSAVIERRQPVSDWRPSDGFGVRPPIEPLRTLLYTDAAGRVATWNPATGAKKMITGG
jgi:hypothetical protein